jgi:predicted Zn-dependent protease with MMP-like domain
MPIAVQELVKDVPEGVREQVIKTKEACLHVVRNAIKAECLLVLRGDGPEDAGVSVPVSVEDGLPRAIRHVQLDDTVRWLLQLRQYRNDLVGIAPAMPRVQKLAEELERVQAPLPSLGSAKVAEFAGWIDSLVAAVGDTDPLAPILMVAEDVLGAYIYETQGVFDDRTPNRARIGLYWTVIGLACKSHGWKVEDLTVVVLAHELAHAYTQLGADIAGRRWRADKFAAGDVSLKEGLAQYFTQRCLQRISSRFPAALPCFTELMHKQPPAYRAHLPWVEEANPEAIRQAMLEVRRNSETTIAQFDERLKVAIERLG